MTTAPIVVYTLPDCPNCEQLKGMLHASGIVFETRDLEDETVMTELLYQGIVPTTAPLLQADNKFLTLDEVKKLGLGHLAPAPVAH